MTFRVPPNLNHPMIQCFYELARVALWRFLPSPNIHLFQSQGCTGTLETVSARFQLLGLLCTLVKAREKFHP